jgi:tripartite-type tricarboxylate transporter receptor subunit TctC
MRVLMAIVLLLVSMQQAVAQHRFVIPTGPGGTFDRYGRLIARHIGKYLPGSPTFVPVNMPGASGIIAANYLFSAAPRDGATIGILQKTIPFMPLLGHRGVRYDAARFHWIGSPARLGEVMVVWRGAGITRFDQVKTRTLKVGVTTSGGAHYFFPKLAKDLLGARFDLVVGYVAAHLINAAMERGEVDARAAEAWSEWKSIKPDWVRAGKVVPIVQIGLTSHPELQHVPLATSLSDDLKVKAMFAMIGTVAEISRPIVVPPGTPIERVLELRAAFDAAMASPGLRADAKRIGAEISPIGGDELTAMVRQILAASPDVLTSIRRELH